ncbi:MAG: hypothetical protein ACTSYA_12815 [Candidatus Kariarchaeaceae archaeon]
MIAVVLLQQVQPEDSYITFAYNLNKNMYYVIIPIPGIAAIKLVQFFIGITGLEDEQQVVMVNPEDYKY